MKDYIPLIALVVTQIALVVGWLVSGTQRVTEALTSERRAAYLELLSAADATRRGDHDSARLALAVQRAEFVASDEMNEARLIHTLEQAAQDGERWPEARDRFFTAARFETQQNSATKRRRQRAEIYGS